MFFYGIQIWYCDACQIKRQVGSHKKKAGKTTKIDPKKVRAIERR
jgi:hypothetical protein